MHDLSAHRRMLADVVERSQTDDRIVGLALSGSFAHGEPDEFSDIDLVVVVDDDHHPAVMARRREILANWVPLVAAFTGEHVGEPRVVITMVGPPLLHVDFLFVSLADVAGVGTPPSVLWERDGLVSAALAQRRPQPAGVDAQWIEDRFWTWVHYGATKLARGELFEVIDFLAFLRETVLGPFIARRAGLEPRGMRRLEALSPQGAESLRATLCRHEREDAARALRAAVALYREYVDDDATIRKNEYAERLAVGYLDDVAALH